MIEFFRLIVNYIYIYLCLGFLSVHIFEEIAQKSSGRPFKLYHLAA